MAEPKKAKNKERKLSRAEFAEALKEFPKWGKKVLIDSDKDYSEELLYQ